MAIVEIPYVPDTIGIFPFPDRPEYYCFLKKDAVEALSRDATIILRDDLEHILSESTNKKMELGYATYALNITTHEIAVLCYFKEEGVPQWVK